MTPFPFAIHEIFATLQNVQSAKQPFTTNTHMLHQPMNGWQYWSRSYLPLRSTWIPNKLVISQWKRRWQTLNSAFTAFWLHKRKYPWLVDFL